MASVEAPAIGSIEIPSEPERTLAAFLAVEDWRKKKNQTDVELAWTWHRAEENSQNLEAHNFSHETDALWYANIIADIFESAYPHMPRVNRKILNAGALFHDSGKTEAEAAANFRKNAAELGYSEPETISVEYLIFSTAEEIIPTNIEQVILNIADLHTVGESRTSFKDRGQFFLEESRNKFGKAFKPLKYRRANARRLSKFVMKDLSLMGLASEWLEQARENVRLDIQEIAREQHRGVMNEAKKIGGKAIQLLLDKPQSASKS